MKETSCLFCQLAQDHPVQENEYFYARFDKYPVTPGHLLVIPKRHVETLFELSEVERSTLFPFIEECKNLLEEQFSPTGFNFGVNQGQAAGQTIPHLHIHLIPRYPGDLPDPEGGVRGVIPGKRKYRNSPE